MKIRLILLSLLFANLLNAQNSQKIETNSGEEITMLTLSGGRYDEFHEYQDYERVGSVIIDMRTKKIAGFVNRDTIRDKAFFEIENNTRFFCMDRFSEKYIELTPYQYAANNPILNIDVNGDSVSVGNLYAKDKNGEYINKNQIKSFEVWASTDAGKQYILEHAQKGFNLTGVFEKDLAISAESDGKSHEKGVDVTFDTKEMYPSGQTNRKLGDDDRLKLTYSMASGYMSDSKQSIFSGVETWSHEVYVHGDHHEKKFLGQSSYSDFQNNSHMLPFASTKYYQIGIETLQQAQRILNFNIINTRDYIYYNVMLPNYNYNIQPKSNIKK